MADDDRSPNRGRVARTIGLVSLVIGSLQLLTATVPIGPDDYSGLHIARVLVGMFAALVGIGLLAWVSAMRRRR